MKKFLLGLFVALLIVPGVLAEDIIDVPLLGEVLVSEMPLLLSTVLIAGADGFNPCSIWVLLFLLGIIIHTKSRKKILLVGSVFLLTTAAVYGLFIVGIFNIFTFMNQITSITYFVAILALIFGLVNIKDYFFYKKGISFTIPDKYKPKIFKQSRELVIEDNTWILIVSTFLLALGIAIIELPCTAGLPLIWSSIVASAGAASFYAYLLLYLFVYLLIEVIILLTVLVTLKSFKMTEFKGRVLKLVGGLLITALAIVLLVDSTLMNNINFALGIILGSIALSFVIVLIDKFFRRIKK
ncbi:MAG: hypothetical protein ACMXX7_00340 [Candidatus Woesearchaeota archaeon]